MAALIGGFFAGLVIGSIVTIGVLCFLALVKESKDECEIKNKDNGDK